MLVLFAGGLFAAQSVTKVGGTAKTKIGGTAKTKVAAVASLSYIATVLSYSPVGYWQLNDTTGTLATDSGSVVNNGVYRGGFTLNQTPPPVTGGGGAVLLNGTTGYIDVASNAAYNVTTGSIGVVFKTTSSGVFSELVGRDNGSSDRVFLVRVNSSNKLEVVAIYGGNPSIASSASVNDGAWHFGVYTWTQSGGNTNIELFLDGASQGTATASANSPSSSQPLYFGSYQGSINFLNGLIGQVVFYSTALNATDVSTQYAAR